MKRILISSPIFVLALFFAMGLTRMKFQATKDNYWLKKCDGDRCGYVDRSGKTRIRLGKYYMVFTDTFRTMAIVLDTGFIGINKNCKKMFNIFCFDNGPDDVSEGLFRITDSPNVLHQKIGFAKLTGEIVIPDTLDFAYPFSEGLSAYCEGCVTKFDKYGEHTYSKGGKWGYINKSGEIVIKPQFDWAYSFSNDTAWAGLDSTNCYIDKTGKILKTWKK
jgi:hypothetical protein